jgi:DNA-directed RNA polymerase II subunit RPB1
MSLSTEHKLSKAPVRRVAAVQFSLLNPDEWLEVSVTKQGQKCGAKRDGIWNPSVEETDEDGNLIYGNLSDPRLGTIFDGRPCETCNEGKTDCPGHWGHILLGRPILHPEHIKTIIDILMCICTSCSRLRLRPKIDAHDTKGQQELKQELNRVLSMPIKSREQRLHRVKLVCEKANRCGHSSCGNVLSKFSRNQANPLQILEQRQEVDENDQAKDKDKTTVSGEDVRKWFTKMSAHTRKCLGFDNEKYGKPEWLLLTVLPVSPPHVRPSVRFGAKASHDDITQTYVAILKCNQRFETSSIREDNGKQIREAEDHLTWAVSTLFNNERGGLDQSVAKRDRRVLRTLRSRMVGKAGRVRGNLMGKRVDFSGRTVITADPNLLIGQVGVPESIAKTLTFPERVTTFNRTWLTRFIRNGNDDYPGANFIVKKQNNATLDLR